MWMWGWIGEGGEGRVVGMDESERVGRGYRQAPRFCGGPQDMPRSITIWSERAVLC